jgi:probable HAF family extracellular repeat protein
VIVGTTSATPGAAISVFRVTSQGSSVKATGLTGSPLSTEVSVSADGSTVVGTYRSANGEEAFRWVGDGPLEGLGDLPGGDFQSNAFGVSADGSVVVGTSQRDSDPRAFRWTAAGGMVGLGGNETSARAVSADGSVIVGSLSVGEEPRSAFRFTMQTGSMELPPLPRPRTTSAEAQAVTADGSVVVGRSSYRIGLSGITDEAFRWTQQEGTTSLQSTPYTSGGWGYTVPSDVSADGSVVVGGGQNPITTSGAAFYWTPEIGMVDLRDLLVFGGATNLDGWKLVSANAASADGRKVVGRALGPNGYEAFVATIGAIPEPSTLVLSLIAVATLIVVATRNTWHSDTTRKESLPCSHPLT